MKHQREYEHGNVLLEILDSDVNRKLGEYDGEMRKAIKQIILNIDYEEIKALAKVIVEMASKCQVIMETKKIIESYEVEITEG